MSGAGVFAIVVALGYLIAIPLALNWCRRSQKRMGLMFENYERARISKRAGWKVYAHEDEDGSVSWRRIDA